MDTFKIRYKGFKKKAVTLSFDDGTFYDVWFIDFLNKHGIKATFNINSGLFGADAILRFREKDIFHNRVTEEQAKLLYRGHEIASHSLRHPLLVGQSEEVLREEIDKDIENIARIFGEKPQGFVVPGGPYDEKLIKFLSFRFRYVRAAKSRLDYSIPESFLPFCPSVFILDNGFEKLCRDYIGFQDEEISWLYIWGHSYEFSLDGVWEKVKNAIEGLLEGDDIFFATNGELIGYIEAARALKISDGVLINASDKDVFIEYKNENIMVPARSERRI